MKRLSLIALFVALPAFATSKELPKGYAQENRIPKMYEPYIERIGNNWSSSRVRSNTTVPDSAYRGRTFAYYQTSR